MRHAIKQSFKKLELNQINPYLLNVSIQCDINLGLLSDEVDRSVNIYNVKIELYNNEKWEKKIIIGEISAYYISGYDWVTDKFENLMFVADALDGDLLTSIAPVLDSEGQLVDDFFGLSVLYISDLYIKPNYRGKGIGSLVFPLILKTIGRDVGAITIIPTPTEDDGKEIIDSNDPRYITILNRMCKFIMNHGFYKIDHENRVWIKNTSMRD